MIITIVSYIYTPPQCISPPTFQLKFLHRYFYLACNPSTIYGRATKIATGSSNLKINTKPEATSLAVQYLHMTVARPSCQQKELSVCLYMWPAEWKPSTPCILKNIELRPRIMAATFDLATERISKRSVVQLLRYSLKRTLHTRNYFSCKCNFWRC